VGQGLAEKGVVLKHGLRNAIIPVVTLLGTQLPQIIGGTVVIETVFGLPGMSRFLFDAINQRDYPVIQGVNLLVVSTVVMVNLMVDALYAVLDPRIGIVGGAPPLRHPQRDDAARSGRDAGKPARAESG
jgi:ABC-type dipeptide/oligopeptide/nickel transport system permease component